MHGKMDMFCNMVYNENFLTKIKAGKIIDKIYLRETLIPKFLFLFVINICDIIFL